VGLPIELLIFTTEDHELEARVRGMFPRASVHTRWPDEPLERRRVVRVGDRFSVALDLAEDWELETNYDAEERLMEILLAGDPELYARLEWDTEAGAVWVIVSSESDVTALLAFVDAHTPPAA
jgi:hypothetical protein